MTIWVVLMLFLLLGGGYCVSNPAYRLYGGTNLIAWVCVLILGMIIFGGISTGGEHTIMR